MVTLCIDSSQHYLHLTLPKEISWTPSIQESLAGLVISWSLSADGSFCLLPICVIFLFSFRSERCVRCICQGSLWSEWLIYPLFTFWLEKLCNHSMSRVCYLCTSTFYPKKMPATPERSTLCTSIWYMEMETKIWEFALLVSIRKQTCSKVKNKKKLLAQTKHLF